jgi:Transposase zinc-ribbon domain
MEIAFTSTVRIRFAPFDFSRSVAGVARPAYPPTILVFQEHFATEEACREYLFASRWPDGFRWSRCGGERARAKTSRHPWVCTACGYQAPLTAGDRHAPDPSSLG